MRLQKFSFYLHFGHVCNNLWHIVISNADAFLHDMQLKMDKKEPDVDCENLLLLVQYLVFCATYGFRGDGPLADKARLPWPGC